MCHREFATSTLVLTTVHPTVALMDLGYVTHAVHANSRLVYLAFSLSDDKATLTVTGPPDGNIYPPGPGFIYVVVNGVPSVGVRLLVGDGKGPVVDHNALNKWVPCPGSLVCCSPRC